MLKELIDKKLVEGRAIVGFYYANTVGDDDIQLYSEDGKEIQKLHMLRQQIDLDQDSFVSQADFIAPLNSGIKDYVGMFACSAGFGQEELCKKYLDD